MAEHSVSYGQTVSSTAIQLLNITQVQIRQAVPPNHTTGLAVINHMNIEASQ